MKSSGVAIRRLWPVPAGQSSWADATRKYEACARGARPGGLHDIALTQWGGREAVLVRAGMLLVVVIRLFGWVKAIQLAAGGEGKEGHYPPVRPVEGQAGRMRNTPLFLRARTHARTHADAECTERTERTERCDATPAG